MKKLILTLILMGSSAYADCIDITNNYKCDDDAVFSLKVTEVHGRPYYSAVNSNGAVIIGAYVDEKPETSGGVISRMECSADQIKFFKEYDNKTLKVKSKTEMTYKVVDNAYLLVTEKNELELSNGNDTSTRTRRCTPNK